MTGDPRPPRRPATTGRGRDVRGARGFLEYPGVTSPTSSTLAALAECDRILATWGSPGPAVRARAPATPGAEIYPEPSATRSRAAPTRGRPASSTAWSGSDARVRSRLRPPAATPAIPRSRQLHADAVIDPNTAFDIQTSSTSRTQIGPGGGRHRIRARHAPPPRARDPGRPVPAPDRGERQWEGPAGSIVVFHHGLWRRGMPNSASGTRRAHVQGPPQPGPDPQVRLWDAADLEVSCRARSNDHIFRHVRHRTDRDDAAHSRAVDGRAGPPSRTDRSYPPVAVPHRLARLRPRLVPHPHRGPRPRSTEADREPRDRAPGAAVRVDRGFESEQPDHRLVVPRRQPTPAPISTELPARARGVDVLADGWRLIQSSQLVTRPTGDEHAAGVLEYEWLFERIVASDGR